MSRRVPMQLTDEDFDCWLWALQLWRRAHGGPAMAMFDRLSCTQDWRDADLMHACQLARRNTFPVDMPPLRIRCRGEVLLCGGHLWDLDPEHRHTC